MDNGRFGVWRPWRDFAAMSEEQLAVTAAELQSAGYRTLWIGGAMAELDVVEPMLAATSLLTVASGILNIWTEPADEAAASHRRIDAAYPDRLLLGVGAGHREANAGQDYQRPYTRLAGYVDELTAGGVPREHIVLAALGPRVLALAVERTRGAHPYLVTPEHTGNARRILGPGPLLAPEQKVVLDDNPATARATARRGIGMYLGLSNYLANLRRLGFTEEDLADGGSDRLVDALVAWGSLYEVAARIAEHLAAGADHVGVQLLSGRETPAGQPEPLPLEEYRRLGEALTG